VNDLDCVRALLPGKDALRSMLRPERTRALPDLVPERLSAYLAFTAAWADDTDAALRAQVAALRGRPHTVTLTPVAR
jgi:hypothetical protein